MLMDGMGLIAMNSILKLKMSLRWANSLVQGHMTKEWGRWHLNPFYGQELVYKARVLVTKREGSLCNVLTKLRDSHSPQVQVLAPWPLLLHTHPGLLAVLHTQQAHPPPLLLPPSSPAHISASSRKLSSIPALETPPLS